MRVLEVKPDRLAQAWIDARPAHDWLVAYDIHRCCGGGKICRVSVRPLSAHDDPEQHVAASLPGGARIMIDGPAARRLPSRFGLTVRGRGPFKHLDLELTGDQWGELLYS
jgi:hypothetical protein